MSLSKISNDELSSFLSTYPLLIDTRPTAEFADGYLKGAINVVLNSNFDARASYFSDKHEEIILVAREEDFESLKELISDDLIAKSKGVVLSEKESWLDKKLPMDMIINVDPYELNLDLKHDAKAIVLDVRTGQQFDEEHIVGAVNMQMNDFKDSAKIGLLDENSNLYLHCNGGTRSVLLTSVLKREGFHNVRNIEGGFKAVLTDGNIPTHSNNKKSQN
jgi:rhodanese-related sulfurtransferase